MPLVLFSLRQPRRAYTVSAIHKGESLTDKVDTGFLWKLAALDAAAAKAGKSVAKLLEGGAAVKPQHLQTARKPARLHTGQAFSLPSDHPAGHPAQGTL